MSFKNSQYRPENSLQTGFGVGPYDYMVNTYDGNDLIQIDYYRGGEEASGEHIARIVMTYDVSGNMLTAKRTV